MSFHECTTPFRGRYVLDKGDDANSFFEPCLAHSKLYRRFSPGFHRDESMPSTPALAAFIAAGGKIRLLTFAPLERATANVLGFGANSTCAVSTHGTTPGAKAGALLQCQPAPTLKWLTSTGALEVRVAVPNEASENSSQTPHRFGIFSDAEDNHIFFKSSAYTAPCGLWETAGALEVTWSWGDPDHVAARKAEWFDAIWDSRIPGWRVMALEEVPEEFLIGQGVEDASSVLEDSAEYQSSAGARACFAALGVELRDYQKDAIRAWLQNHGRGILAMATGAGKTLTALFLASRVAEKNRPLVLIVVCPYVDLARQWIHEIRRFGLEPVACFHSRTEWETPLQSAYQRVTAGLSEAIAVVVTNSTFLSAAFQAAIRPGAAVHLLVADEVHNLGASQLRHALPERIPLRLGLSATPERHGDQEGTQAIFDYFGDVVFELGIDEAIRRGVLVPYHYHPVLVDLTEQEADRYTELTAKIARAWAKADDDLESDQLKMLLLKRARLLASAANKLPALSSVLAAHGQPVEKAIVYCGDGTMECQISSEVEKQILAVTRLLGNEHQLRIRKFTCEESSEEREEILAALRSGSLDAVVAIRCLDEGIDVPDVRLGFLLASSTNPRQFIQRRGRLLRRAPGKNRAVIYDFIVRPPDFGSAWDSDAFNLERRMFQRELKRILEFCGSAENGPVALNKLKELRVSYNLLAAV